MSFYEKYLDLIASAQANPDLAKTQDFDKELKVLKVSLER